MIWGKTWEQRRRERLDVHEVFAWLPVALQDGRRAWLRKVYRQRLLINGWEDPHYYLENPFASEAGLRRLINDAEKAGDAVAYRQLLSHLSEDSDG